LGVKSREASNWVSSFEISRRGRMLKIAPPIEHAEIQDLTASSLQPVRLEMHLWRASTVTAGSYPFACLLLLPFFVSSPSDPARPD
jgi:hypothetical protein